MATATPNYTDTGAAIVSIQTVAVGADVRGTLALTTKRGAWIFAAFGRQGTTALTAGCAVLIRRTLNAGVIEHAAGPTFVGDVTAAARTTCAAASNNAGVNTIVVASTTGFAAGDLIFIDDTGNVGIANSEWARVSKVTDTTHLLLDAPTQFAHNSVSAHVSNHADVWPPVWVDGGCTVEVVFDYGASTTGDTNACRALVATYDNDTIV